MSIRSVIESNGLEEVAELSSGDWDWSTTGVYFQRSSGLFFILEDGGCSCNYYGEDVNDLSDLDQVSRERAISAIVDFAGGGYLAASADDVQREIAKVRDFR
jgi:hypothetical protein